MPIFSSPEVQIREFAANVFVPYSSTADAAFVGQFRWGPVNSWQLIDDPNQLVEVFGKPSETNYREWFSASNFLGYSNNLKVVRVVDSQGDNKALNSSTDTVGLLVRNEEEYSQMVYSNDVGYSEGFVARYPGVMGDSLKVSMADSATYETWNYKNLFDFAPGTSTYAEAKGAANDELHIVVVDEKGLFTGEPGFILETFAFVSKASDARNGDNDPIFYGNIVNKQSQYLWYFTPPKTNIELDIEYRVKSITAGTAGTNYGKPIVTITGGSGVGATATASINANGAITGYTIVNPGAGYNITDITVTITDSGKNAAARALVDTDINGDRTGVISAVVPVEIGSEYYTAAVEITDDCPGTGAVATCVLETGSVDPDAIDIDNAGSGYVTDYVRCSFTAAPGGGTTAIGRPVVGTVAPDIGKITGISFTGATADGIACTVGSGYLVAPSITFHTGGIGAEVTPVIGDVGTPDEGEIREYIVVNGGKCYYDPSVTITPGGTGATATIEEADLEAEDETGTNWDMPCLTPTGTPRSFYSLKDISEDGGWTKLLTGGSDGGAPSSADYIMGWDLFKNKEEVEVGLLILGAAGGDTTCKSVIRYVVNNIAEHRKDCVAFFSPSLGTILNKSQSQAAKNIVDFSQNTSNGISIPSSYSVMDSGWKLQYDIYHDKYRWIPLNADIAGLCARTETDYDAWWSPAGYNRGRIQNVVTLAYNPNKSSRDMLYRANINPVVSFVGEGTVLYGDKTQQTKDTAFSFINVRRLFINLEKSIAKAAKYQLFEFNDAYTRQRFVGIVEPYLRLVKARRGIYDFKVVCSEVNNTPEVIDRAQFVASIFIKPSRSINFVTLNFVAVGTGVDFNEVVGMYL